MSSESIFFPKDHVTAQRRLSIVSAVIGFTGVLFFKWQVSEVIYLFMWDVLLMWVSTVLRMLFALGGRDKILGRIIWAIGFAVLYMGMFAILLSFLLIHINIQDFTSSLGSVKVATWAMVANHAFGFVVGYMLNGKNKTATTFGQMFSTMFYVLPMVTILVIFVFPNSLTFGEAQQNTWIATAIVNIRFAFDMLSAHLQRKRHLYY